MKEIQLFKFSYVKFIILVLFTSLVSSEVNLKPVSHVIFDLDGTLVDTVSAYHESLNKVIAKFNKTVPWNIMPQVLKEPTALGGIEVVIKNLNLSLSIKVDEFLEEYNKHLKEAIRNVKLMPGALKLLNHLKSHKIPMGLCTSLNKKDFQFETQHFNDIGLFEIGKYFEVIVTA
ncbi:pseudouridine-5'-phosphatase-like isoform X1, partial [Leptotrombidium deliense]